MDCPMCGANAKALRTLMWVYDSGESFAAAVCVRCAEVHSRLLEREGSK